MPRTSQRLWTPVLALLLAAPVEAVQRDDPGAACPGFRDGTRCHTIEVPEDHDDPASRRIGLHVKVVPGHGEASSGPPIYFLAGGPGQAAADLEPLVAQRFGAALAHRDLVFVDQRGTGRSNPLTCASGQTDDPARFFGPSYTPEELATCLGEVAPRADPRLYTTEQFAHDLDAVAARLGHDRIDVVGGSYGTKAGLVFMREHPERIRVAVLEGVAPPDFLNPLPHARGGQAALDRLFAACAADAACGGRFPDLAARFDALLAGLADDPPLLTVPGTEVQVPLSREAMAYVVHLLLFNVQSSTVVPALVDQVERGRYDTLLTIQRQIVDAVVSGIDIGLQLSVTCTENAPRLRERDLAAETAGTYLGRDMVDGVAEHCASWPAGRVSPDFWDPVTAAVPTLLITGRLDPATPPGFGDDVAAHLPESRLFKVEEGAHITPHPCTDGLIVEFLRTGDLSALDGGCLAEVRRPPFQVPTGG